MLRGGIGKKIITSVSFRDSCVALCHGVPPPRSFTRAIFDSRSLFLDREETLATRAIADRESGVAGCYGVALKKSDRSRTERAVSL